MSEQAANKLDSRVKIALLVIAVATIGALALAALRENILADWHRYRTQYAQLLWSKADDEVGRGAAEAFQIRIEQNFVPELGAVDRCITCHAGVEDPRMAEAPQPFTTHPGRYLELHDPAKFGCTVCHEGQGRATTVDDAHGRVPHWEFPLLESRYSTTSCTKCHARTELFGSNGLVAIAAHDDVGAGFLPARGARLATERGCQGCHVIDGKGGLLGPDLTGEGGKAPSQFNFTHVAGEEARSTSVWLAAHFLEPAKVSPGSVMPAVRDPRHADALTAYMLSLRPKQSGVVGATVREEASQRSGAELYGSYCSACHGPAGQGSRVAGITTPSLNNPDTLAVASDDYLRRIIESGRSGTRMPAWGEGHGNLAPAEIDRIVSYIRSWETAGPRVGDIRAAEGDARRGHAYYTGLCAGCHGDAGQGGVGNALRPATFLAIADDRFLAETILQGRPGTAMPSWKHLSADAISDILAYMRTWQAEPPDYGEVMGAMLRVPTSTNVGYGRALYAQNCQSCHGAHAVGGIGPSLASDDFLRSVDNRYLYRAITEGRPTTAMPAWRHLSADDIGSLITYLRSLQRSRLAPATIEVPAGNPDVGAVFYRSSCAGCHGAQGQGGSAPQLANAVFQSSVDDSTLYRWIAYGRTGTAMKGFLPGAQGMLELTRQQIGDVIAYVRELGRNGQPHGVHIGGGNPAFGSDIYRTTCAACHGATGEGASGPQLNNEALLQAASNGFLTATIILGRDGTPMKPMVHGQEGLGQVPPENVQDLVAYIREWEGGVRPRKARRIAEVDERAVREGGASFSHYCAGCHGHDGLGSGEGEGFFAPALNNQEFLAAASDGFLLATIARGRMGTPMRPFGVGAGGIVSLRYDEIFDIVAYIRSWQRPSGQRTANASAQTAGGQSDEED